MIRDALNYREGLFVKRALRALRIFREICRKSGESCECFVVNIVNNGKVGLPQGSDRYLHFTSLNQCSSGL